MKNYLTNLIKTFALGLLLMLAVANNIYANGNVATTNNDYTNITATLAPTYEDYFNQFYQYYLNLFSLMYANASTQNIQNAQTTNEAIVKATSSPESKSNNNEMIKYADQDDTEFDISYNFKEDEFTGPGIGIIDDVSLVYNDGGPGIIANGFTNSENKQYVDNGPQVTNTECSPSDYLKLSTMKPGDFTFNGSSRKDKLNK